MFQLTRRLGTQCFRLREDWVEEFTLTAAPDFVDIVGVVIEARLVDLYRPDDVALVVPLADAVEPLPPLRLEYGARAENGDVPLILRAPAVVIADALRPHDYRLDLYATADGQTGRFADGVRQFRE